MKQNFLLLGAMALAGLFASCSQTEMEEPANVPQKGNEVTVTVAPSADFTQPRSRAEDGQQLRYIAELWKENKTTSPATATVMISRIEQVGDNANQFSFEIEQQGDYVILFWADYIAASATTSKKTIKRESGENTFTVSFNGYSDNKFTTDGNTKSREGLQGVSIKAFANESKFYNNSDLDNAFCGKVAFTKETDIVSLGTITLKRPLCKYIFKEKTDNLSRISQIKLQYLLFNPGYNVYTKKATGLGNFNENGSGNFHYIDILNSSDKQLFSFYSFGEESELTLCPTVSDGYIKFNFKLNDNDNGKKYKDVQISTSNIPCRANYIYTLSGSFVKEDLTGNTVSVDVTRDEVWSNDSREDLQ